MDMFCCDFFKENVFEAGRKGFSIIPCKIENVDSYFFAMQCRSEDFQENYSTIFISQRTIKYCPWCGKNLAEIIKINKNEIVELAREYEHLVT
jgi:hypothetical protein